MTESLSTDELHARLAEITERELTRGSRYGHLALTTVALIFAGTVGFLLTTAPSQKFVFPVTTVVYLWSILAISYAWVAFGLFVLSRRRPVSSLHELVVGTVALVYSFAFTCASFVYHVGRHGRGLSFDQLGFMTQVGLLTMLIALVVCVRAFRRHLRLQATRERLERELSGG